MNINETKMIRTIQEKTAKERAREKHVVEMQRAHIEKEKKRVSVKTQHLGVAVTKKQNKRTSQHTTTYNIQSEQ